jgi:hypothetical protein
MWGSRAVCVFPEDAEHAVWVSPQFVKHHGPSGPKNEDVETGRLALEQGTTEADSFTNQRESKEMAAGETQPGVKLRN